MGVILSTAKDLFFGPVLFVVLNAVKDLFLSFKGQARILRRLRLLRMTSSGVILSVSEGSDVAFEGIKPGSFGQKTPSG